MNYLILISSIVYSVIAGPVSYASCQTACNTGAVLCYLSAGVVFGVGNVPLCSSIQGVCMASCTPFLIAPIP